MIFRAAVSGGGQAVVIESVRLFSERDDDQDLFGRTWPATWTNNNPSLLRDRVYGFNCFHSGHGYSSFPSGQTAAVLAVGIVLTGANFHFLSDVIAGGFVGISSG